MLHEKCLLKISSSSSYSEIASDTDCVGGNEDPVDPWSQPSTEAAQQGRGSLASLGPHHRSTTVAFRLAGGIIYGPVFFTDGRWSIIGCRPRKLKRALYSS